MIQVFCKHKWITHAKEKYEWEEEVPVDGTKNWYYPKFQKIEYSEIQEILICEKCGKIEKLIY